MHVSVGKVRRGSDGVKYYSKLAREDYYISQSRGRWWGSLAPEFGLHGAVEKNDFATLHNGFSPAGEPL